MNDLVKSTRYTPEQVELITNTIAKGATRDELALLIYQSEKTGLDLLARQMYGVKRWDSVLKRETMAIQTSIDGFRLIAERTGKYAGQRGPFWCGSDGQWVDVWAVSEPPVASKVGILRHDFLEPCWGVARFEAYAHRTKEGKLTRMWEQMPDLMIAKCAEALGLRRAFPQELSGVYTSDEMEQADTPKKSAHQARKDGDWEAMVGEMKLLKTPEELKSWGEQNRDRIHMLPDNWQTHLKDEFARLLGLMREDHPLKRPRGRPPKIKEQLKASLEATTGEIIDDEIPKGIQDPDAYLDNLESQLSAAQTVDDINDVWEEYKLVMPNMFPPDRAKADALFDKHQERVEK